MVKVFNGLAQFTRFVGHLATVSDVAPTVMVGEIARNGYNRALEIYGDSSKLKSLSPYTQAERESLGFTPNDPLLRTGGLRSELEFEHAGTFAGYGSADPVQLYHEVGYVNFRTKTIVPPRPVLRISAQEVAEKNYVVVTETLATMIGAHSKI